MPVKKHLLIGNHDYQWLKKMKYPERYFKTIKDIIYWSDHDNQFTLCHYPWMEWPGRLEILSANPVMLLDACINRASCANVLEALQQLGISKVRTIIGIPADKDYQGVAEAMAPVSAQIILTKSTNAHYKFGPEQTGALNELGITAQWTDGIRDALELARLGDSNLESVEELPIVILGTTSLISDVKELAGTPMPL